MMKLIATALLATTALAGCTGPTTYGTGKNQSTETLTGITDILSIGAPGRSKVKIDYSARPKLVKAPADGSLPPPAESVAGSDAYFPVDPEVERARLRAEAANGDIEVNASDSPQLARLKRESAERAKQLAAEERQYENGVEPHWMVAQKRKERLARQAEVARLNGNTRERKYLTQPPTEYRVPAETAAVGELGEKEVDPNIVKKRNKNGYFGKLLGR